MKALVTGATGFVGYHVVRFLLGRGVRVSALVRKGSDRKALDSLGVEIVTGDVRDYDSVDRALDGCSQLYHLAADYRLWVPDPATMYEINVRGTKNVMEAALRRGVEKVVYTSTVGALTAGSDRRPANEETPVGIEEMVGHYKRSKFIAEKEVRGAAEKGLPVVIVNPSTPVGPMDRRPTPTGKMIVDFLNGRMPAYLDTGLNFVDVEDVAAGHWLAAERGRIGERYILGNSNLTLKDFFESLGRTVGRSAPKVRLPYLPVLIAAYFDEAISKMIPGRCPAIPLAGVRMAGKFMFFDVSKALRELNIPQSPVDRAIARAAAWFTENGYVKAGRG
ncbi:MAG: NAD-dependent epimerase/dehydratase family protein [Nitrospiraceae bacterium]|nr:NAD-dependent epimerase/dehydratase family protein [Nitrospiraceae bacterium]